MPKSRGRKLNKKHRKPKRPPKTKLVALAPQPVDLLQWLTPMMVYRGPIPKPQTNE